VRSQMISEHASMMAGFQALSPLPRNILWLCTAPTRPPYNRTPTPKSLISPPNSPRNRAMPLSPLPPLEQPGKRGAQPLSRREMTVLTNLTASPMTSRMEACVSTPFLMRRREACVGGAHTAS